jgi:hypothetical protein
MGSSESSSAVVNGSWCEESGSEMFSGGPSGRESVKEDATLQRVLVLMHC